MFYVLRLKLLHLIILLVFTLLTFGLTYPVIFRVNSAVFSVYGDPLLTTWILAWDVHKLFSDPLNLFHANIFYPHRNVLAYSENLLASSLLVAPVLKISQNPILAYNVIFLFSFIFSGFGTYFLIWYLTQNPYAGLLSGIIFAFSPYKFSHLGHLHLLSTQWLPFCFLFLHRLLETNRWKYLFLFWLFFILQTLSSSYYALFLSIALVVWVGSYWILSKIVDRGPKIENKELHYSILYRLSPILYPLPSLRNKLGCFVILSILILYPVSYPYFKVQEEMGFARGLGEVKTFSADLQNYLGVAHYNRLYGPFLVRFAKMEAILFPGTLALMFAVFGFIRNFRKSALFPLVGAYGILVISAAILSLGPELHFFGLRFDGPYRFLYNYVPGFKGLRVPARLGVIVSFGISVLAGYGFLSLFSGLTQKVVRKGLLSYGPFLVTITLAVFLIIEYHSAPIPLYKVATGNQVPEVYRWLAKQEGDFPILEFPVQDDLYDYWKESPYLYFSTYHWKKLINGYSGFSPPATILLHQLVKDFPNKVIIQALQRLRTKYLIIHSDVYSKHYLARLLRNLDNFKDYLVFKEKMDEAYIYEFKNLAETDQNLKVSEFMSLNDTNLIPAEIEAIRTNYNMKEASLSFDGNLGTRWMSATPQNSDMYVEIDLKTVTSVNRVLFDMGPSFLEYPRRCLIEVSVNGIQWEPVSLLPGSLLHLFESALQTPKNPQYQLVFTQPTLARFIRVLQIGQDDLWGWAIHEVQVYEAVKDLP
jgi:hypothetical protein